MTHVSPLAPERFPDLPPIAGVTMAACAAGIRYKDRVDLLLMQMAPGTAAAGVFTRSLTASAPVEWCRQALAQGRARAVVVNAGNANAFTGEAGRAGVRRSAAATAGLLGCGEHEIYIASTGVIGELLPDERIIAKLDELKRQQQADAWAMAARAIMTTDTYPKAATKRLSIDGVPVTINGIAKGSGMIAPDMATMLSFVFTDARIAQPVLQSLLAAGANRSFNAITVDSDTSTSDTLLLFATGAAAHSPIESLTDKRIGPFRKALDAVLKDLALQVVRDGEGAERLVEIRIAGAASPRAAKRVGLAIGNSPLVKTAIAAGDANWGRIVMAVGKAGEKADRDRLAIRIGGVAVAERGAAVAGYDEAPVAKHMAGRDILIEVDLGVGKSKATVWTCDLTHRYIDINGSYRS
jgi:glutamate N-acetyltransferase/amino-acid N-acetyltransferase